MRRSIAIVVILTACFARDAVKGCGPDFHAEQWRFWLLQPQLAEARELHPFYFTTDVLAPTNFDEIDEVGYALNIAEWQATLGPGVLEEDIRAILYGGRYCYNPMDDSLAQHNSFLKRLREKKDVWLPFIAFAKDCEVVCQDPDPWGFGGSSFLPLSKAWTKGEGLLKQAKDPMLRARIAYQLVRLSFYEGAGVNHHFDARPHYARHLLPLRGKTWLEPSAAYYLASLLPQPECDLAYARIFSAAKDKRFRMVQLFESANTDTYLTLADDANHRAMLLVMRDLQFPGRALEDLERIAACDPQNEFIPFLLSREVNKLEDWLLTTSLTDMGAAINQWNGPPEGVTQEEVMQADLDYLREVQGFIIRVLPLAAPAQQNMLRVLNGHLSLVAGDAFACMSTMNEVLADAQATDLIKFQASIDLVLAGVMAHNNLTDETRGDILQVVRLAHEVHDDRIDGQTLLDQLHLYLGMKLIQRGEVAEGVFLLARSDRRYGESNGWWSKNARIVAYENATPPDYDRMIELLGKKNKTLFEQYLVGAPSAVDSHRPPDGEIIIDDLNWDSNNSDLRLNRNTLPDYKASWYISQDQLQTAAVILQQIPDSHWDEYPYTLFKGDDPFVANVEDPHNYDNGDSTSVPYNKRTIIERMVELKKEAIKHPKKRALNNYLLG
ncbi:MAG TPA: hypothetical protein PK760_03210, partial [Flavobacteriales bacterium]|nr:hypothetical protein [Flavobacteriales bacterium]